MADSFSPEKVRYIQSVILEIEAIRAELKQALESDNELVVEAYKIDPIHYAPKLPKHIPIDKASKIEALNSYNIQQTDVDGERSPRRTFGIIKVEFDTYDLVSKIAERHNDKIKDLKGWLGENFTTSHARSVHIHAAYPNIIIATLYRFIKIGSETCYSIGYDWNNNQRNSKVVDEDEMRQITENYGDTYDTNGHVALTAQEYGEQVVSTIGKAPAGYEFVLLKNSKVHPQQIYYHRSPLEGKKPYRGREGTYRETLKANNCLILPHNPAITLKHVKPTDYNHIDKTDVSSHYKPIREAAGIYMRKKVHSPKVN